MVTYLFSIDKFLIAAGNAEQFDGNARVDQALEKLGLYKQYQLLHGMSVALMPHQTIGEKITMTFILVFVSNLFFPRRRRMDVRQGER